MQKNPYFSVIIPTLNEEKFLPLLLHDLIKQTSSDFEVIIVDAKSRDRTLIAAQKFNSKLPSLTILTSPRKNVSIQRNLGAKKASGKILLFLDADSGLPKYFLSGLQYKLSKRPADAFTCWIKPDSNKAQDIALATIINLFIEASRLLELPTSFGAMLGFKPKIFAKLGGFNPKITYAEDQEIVRRVVEHKYQFRIYSDPYYIYSFRRLKKQGNLNSLRQFAKMQSTLLLRGYGKNHKTDYPMGGHLFNRR